jgi:hypothetical protein
MRPIVGLEGSRDSLHMTAYQEPAGALAAAAPVIAELAGPLLFVLIVLTLARAC